MLHREAELHEVVEHLLLSEHGALALLEELVKLAALAEVHHDVQRAALDE